MYSNPPHWHFGRRSDGSAGHCRQEIPEAIGHLTVFTENALLAPRGSSGERKETPPKKQVEAIEE
jgi:hypothetical protein